MIVSFQKLFPSLSRDSTTARFHTHEVDPNQCCSAVIQEISAPISTVWSVVHRFDNPQAYKHFLKSCSVIVIFLIFSHRVIYVFFRFMCEKKLH
ncbi:hypothetical protein ARALYDRAFT_892080 [Arabidopsis lyrata subsp. lyrata]|uniref:Uncharacterized protein n=1 Tax=Arabidopsis lyrata subsp. lyrata TaxID=81972 RepID=D7KHN7_ARALL|nr:hypothetical protein ARALYDRAFT_892080 [Arabidopsis lyrata subsp. lyrata]